MSKALLTAISEGVRARQQRLAEISMPGMVADQAADPAIARAPDGAPCWFIPAAAIAERLERLHPRGPQ